MLLVNFWLSIISDSILYYLLLLTFSHHIYLFLVSYKQQPSIMRWNCLKLAEALHPLLELVYSSHEKFVSYLPIYMVLVYFSETTV